MEYKDYKLEDFIFDEGFKRWVLNPDQEDEKYWQDWLSRHPEKASLIDEAREIVLFLSGRVAKSPTSQAFNEVRDRIRDKMGDEVHSHEQAIPAQEPSFKKHPVIKPFIYKIAAAVTVLVTLAAFYFLIFSGVSTIQVATAYGETKTLILPDSSKVVLNANSSLEYAENWEKETHREVRLSGEAFFEVTAEHGARGNDLRKFIVHTDDIAVEVVGTTFNVNDRQDRTQVVLNSGKIRLSSKLDGVDPLYMEPGELVELDKKSASFKQTKVDPELYTSWRNQKLIFRERSISEIVQVLENNFGISVQLEDPALGQKKYTGTIPMDNYELFFTTLSRIMEVNIVNKGEEYVIKKKNSTRP